MRHDEKYTLIFAAIVTLSCSVLLATAATVLKSKQDANVALDKRRNILRAFGFDVHEKTREEINALFGSRIEPRAIDAQGKAISGMTPANIENLNLEEEQKRANPAEQRNPLFVLKNETGQVEAFCVPIFGKGLWSTLYGYLALEKDGNTLRGITYYKHGETPGLGAEVENPSWQKQFVGKTIYEGNDLVSVKVLKGKDTHANPHAVNSISGATLTSNGVTRMLEKNLKVYADYLKKSANPI